LNRKRADVADELANDSITESVIIEVEDILHDLMNQLSDPSFSFFFTEKNDPRSCHKDPERVSRHCT
jgi:hypothetical protein